MISELPRGVWAVVFGLAFLISCAGSGSAPGDILAPDIRMSEQEEPAGTVGAGHYLWSYHEIYLNPQENEIRIVPLRQALDHWNVLKWLEQWPCTNCLKVTSLTQVQDTLLADVQITHPFSGATLTGFDVRGIAIFGASKTFPASGLTLSDRTLGDTELLNPDGFTTLYNSSTEGSGPGGLQGYIKGKLAAPVAPNGMLNGYRRFITQDASNTRNAFFTNQSVTTTYEMEKSPGPIVLGYAVDVSWAKADNIPVTDPMIDFPPEANCAEPWKITVSGDPIVENGDTLLTIEVYDWQGADTHSGPVIECPELFNGTLTASFVSDMGGYSTWEITVPNSKSAPVGDYRCLVSVEANENDPVGKPWLDLTAYQIAYLSVIYGGEGWARTWGGPGNDKGLDLGIGSDGNIYTSGNFMDSVDFDPGPADIVGTANGGYDAYLSKFDSNGVLLWAKTWGGSQDDGAYGVEVDSHGNACVAGCYEGVVDFDPDPSAEDIHDSGTGTGSFVCKYDPDGDLLWSHTWDVWGNSQARDLDVGPDDNIYVVGYERIDTGQFACYLRKVKSSGGSEFHLLWAGINYFVPFDDEFAVIADNFSNVYVTGLFDGTKDFDPGLEIELHECAGYYDAFLSKFHTDGTYQWSLTWGSDSYQHECGSGVGTDSAGNVYVSGYWGGETDFDPGIGTAIYTATGWDAFCSKFNSDGIFQWVDVWGGEDAVQGIWRYGDAATDLIVDGSDNIYVTGNSADETDFDPGPGEYILTSNSYSDSYLTKLSPDGSLQWARVWGGADDCCQDDESVFWESGLGIASSVTGAVYTTGMYSSMDYDLVDFAPSGPPCNEDADYHDPDDKFECYLIKFMPDGCW